MRRYRMSPFQNEIKCRLLGVVNDHLLESGLDVWVRVVHRRWWTISFVIGLVLILGPVVEWVCTGEKVEEDDTIRPNVGLESICFAFKDFRGSVSNVAENPVRLAFIALNNGLVKLQDLWFRLSRSTSIGQVVLFPGIGHQDTGRFQIPDKNAVIMEVLERFSDLLGNFSNPYFTNIIILHK